MIAARVRRIIGMAEAWGSEVFVEICMNFLWGFLKSAKFWCEFFINLQYIEQIYDFNIKIFTNFAKKLTQNAL